MKKIRGWIIGIVVVAAVAVLIIWGNSNSSPTTTADDTPETPTSTIVASPSAATSTSYNFAHDLGVGSTGTEVMALQQILIDKGYLTIVSAPTGYFGPYTKAAFAEYQTANGVGASGETTTAATTGQYKDGTYTGTVADAIYGKLQVTVTISGGKIANVTLPIYPNSPGHTSQVSATALPALEQEAIISQSANVNVVSGATQDSAAFQQSLASALAQASG
jgi:uncharacterized protein with FMN-binding domain